MSTPTPLTRAQRWTANSKARRQRLAKEGGGQFFALLDGDYMAKVNKLLAWRNKAWRKLHGRGITKTDLLKLMIDADVAQVNRRKRVTARRSGTAAGPTTASEPRADDRR